MTKIYVIPDIHGCLDNLKKSIAIIESSLNDKNTKLVFLGDYIHGGEDSKEVLEYIINLQNKYGENKIIAILGNH